MKDQNRPTHVERPFSLVVAATLILGVLFSFPAVEAASPQHATPSLIMDHVVINEFEQDPPGDDRSGGEFVELFNPISESVHIGNWIIYTTHGDISSYEIPGGTLIASGGFWQVTFTNQFIDNKEDSLVLLNALGQHIDETPNLADTGDDLRSWQRYPDGSDNWIYALPSTRGVTNIPEYPSAPILAVAIIAATLLMLRRKRNVLQTQRH